MTTENNSGSTPGGPQAPSAPAGEASPSSQPSSPAPSGAPGSADPGSPRGPSGVDILNFDPFAPPSAEGAQPGDEGQPPAQDPQNPAQPASGPSAPQPQVTPEVAALQRQIAELRSMIPQGQPGAQPQQPGQQQLQQPQRRYQAQVPQQIMQMMSSEDVNERMQGVTTLVNGIGEMVHDTVMNEVRQLLESVRTEVPQQVMATAREREQQQALFQDFYGKYPMLNNPRLYGIVTATAAELAQQMGVNGWTPEFRDRLGQEVLRTLGWQAGAPASQPKPGAKPNAVAPGGSRPATPQVDGAAAEMQELLN